MTSPARDATPQTSTRTTRTGAEQLHHRDVLWEADRRDQQTARYNHLISTRQRLDLSHGSGRWPLLEAFTATHDGWPPSITQSHAARYRHLNAIHAGYGPLVLLRHDLDELNHWPLRSADLVDEARPLIRTLTADLLLPGTSHTVNLQRGGCGGTHWHPVAPLSGLLPEHAAQVKAAKHGRGGGCELLDGLAYGVVLLDTPEARQGVARYVTRHPDGRLDTPGTEDYLDALEAELTPRTSARRLGWEIGVRPLL